MCPRPTHQDIYAKYTPPLCNPARMFNNRYCKNNDWGISALTHVLLVFGQKKQDDVRLVLDVNGGVQQQVLDLKELTFEDYSARIYSEYGNNYPAKLPLNIWIYYIGKSYYNPSLVRHAYATVYSGVGYCIDKFLSRTLVQGHADVDHQQNKLSLMTFAMFDDAPIEDVNNEHDGLSPLESTSCMYRLSLGLPSEGLFR